jgi:glycosyltransferase involved in cell wall biosynthesis
MEEGLSVAVLIPTFRRPEELARCLSALAGQRRRPDRVLVVARAEDEPTRHVAAADHDGLTVERVLVEAPGQIAALNAGLDALREDIVAITDDDCIPRPDWLERIERHFAADPRLGGLGGPDRLTQGGMPVVGARRSVGRVFWYGRFVGLHQLGIGPVRDVELLKGANMSYRREAVGRLRFDTHLRGSGTEQHNDWTFSLAVRAAGWRVAFDPAVVVDHDEAARAVGNPRFAADPQVATEHAHNQTYAAVRHLPRRRVVAHLLYSALIGTTTSPGVAMTVVNLVSRHEPRAAGVLRFRLALRARADGAATGLRERRRAGGPAPGS